MKLHRRARTAVLLLVLLAGLPGTLLAGCGAACPPAAQRMAMPCCHPATNSASVVRAASCCPAVEAATPQPAQGINLPAAAPLTLAAPLALPAEPLAERPAPEPPATPPPLHEGIGLYTLNAVFLI